ncbi:hypothetical protein SAMN04488056_103242 [Cohaesibacter marisflavi]|uniref:Uncharacterized protein n=1 Tax=Cohaesibacter marisflavi TaxID=655353 RepID=A0A1I5ELY0_9HYPH|nr:hypothetical protein SAMN04488056_103242 [Cohaesibacter marisflavi]
MTKTTFVFYLYYLIILQAIKACFRLQLVPRRPAWFGDCKFVAFATSLQLTFSKRVAIVWSALLPGRGAQRQLKQLFIFLKFLSRVECRR